MPPTRLLLKKGNELRITGTRLVNVRPQHCHPWLATAAIFFLSELFDKERVQTWLGRSRTSGWQEAFSSWCALQASGCCCVIHYWKMAVCKVEVTPVDRLLALFSSVVTSFLVVLLLTCWMCDYQRQV